MKKTLTFIFLFVSIFTFAQNIVFRTSVENLRLRESPNLESKVIKTVSKGENLSWLNVRSEQKATVDWKGGKVTDYWYKVFYDNNKDSVVWVFGKGISLYRLNIGDYDRKDSINYNIDNDWIRIIKSNKKAFSSLAITAIQWNENPLQKEREADLKGKPFTLSFKNGKKITYNEFENEERQYIGELPELEFYIIEGGICCNVYSAISKKNGKLIRHIEMPLFSNNKTPIFSQDKQVFVSQSGCEPGGEDAIAFSQIMNENIELLAEINVFPVRDFRFITNYSGIAKLQNGEYWKIIFK